MAHETRLDGVLEPRLVRESSPEREEQVVINLREGNSSALIREASHERSRHVVMPLRL